jgi:hypothetical protein
MLGLSAEPTLWIETDAYGRIRDIAPDTATLLGLTARGACARDLRLFFPAAFRSLNELMREAHYQIVEGTHNLYPRDRRPVRVLIRIQPSSSDRFSTGLRWTFQRV